MLFRTCCFFLIILGSCLLLISSFELARATEPFAKVGLTTGLIHNFPRGTRSLAMGGTGAADPSYALNTYHNPANVFLLKGLHLTGGYNDWPGNIDFQDYGVFWGQSFGHDTTRTWHLGGGVRYTHLRVGDSYLRTIYTPEGIGRTINLKDYYLVFTVGGGVSNELFDVGAGFSVKPTRLGFFSSDEWFWAYDFGMLARLRVTNPAGIRVITSAGISILNLGGPVNLAGREANIPDQVRVGAGMRIEFPQSSITPKLFSAGRPAATLSCSFEYLDRMYDPYVDEDGLAIGIEASFLSALSLRMGNSNNNSLHDGTTYGFGLGWEVDRGRIQFDYARFPINPILGTDHEDSYGVSIRMGF